MENRAPNAKAVSALMIAFNPTFWKYENPATN
jgi:hypothetical protein